MNTCAVISAEYREPLAGTAAGAVAWVLVEEPGPWGAKAVAESGWGWLDSAASGVRAGLIRRHGRGVGEGVAYVAYTGPGSGWVRRVDPGELRGMDFAAVAEGRHQGVGEEYRGEPLALVCTNGRRDRCCATLGRPLAAELAAAGYGAVWETTHLGGHRFAPTMLVLPYGYAYGRLTAGEAKEVLAAAADGRMVPGESCRGRSTWARPGQAAELAVRERIGEDGAEVLTVSQLSGRDWKVAHTDGRAWTVGVAEVTSTPARPESCGKAPGMPTRMEVRAVRAVD